MISEPNSFCRLLSWWALGTEFTGIFIFNSFIISDEKWKARRLFCLIRSNNINIVIRDIHQISKMAIKYNKFKKQAAFGKYKYLSGHLRINNKS